MPTNHFQALDKGFEWDDLAWWETAITLGEVYNSRIFNSGI
jgi:hypothetical protein